MTKIALLDYGMGNLHSVAKALTRVGAEVLITQDAAMITRSDKIVFPGVGAMKDCMAQMHATGVSDAVRQAVFNKPVMAICVGMQALFEYSAENGGVAGLGILAGEVRQFVPAIDRSHGSQYPIKVPHMGWNTTYDMDSRHPIWRGIAADTHFYYVHSYYCVPQDDTLVAARCHYGHDFCASILKDNLFATQFHPEKSHTAGIQLLQNFVEWRI